MDRRIPRKIFVWACREAGICTQCLKNEAEEGYARCEKCRLVSKKCYYNTPRKVHNKRQRDRRAELFAKGFCSRCCANTAEAGLGAIVGAGVGACMGCSCAIALSGEAEEDGTPMTDEEKTAMAAFLTPTGAVVGAAVGAVVGPEECLRCAGEACQAACEAQGRYGGKRKTRKRKTRKGKQKKRRKTRKRKRKRTVKRKRKKKRKKTRRRRKK